MLRINIDGQLVKLYINGDVVWEGTLEEWSYALANPILNPYIAKAG